MDLPNDPNTPNNDHKVPNEIKKTDDETFNADLSLFSINSEKKDEISYNLSSIFESSRFKHNRLSASVHSSLFPFLSDEGFKKIKTFMSRRESELHPIKSEMQDVSSDNLLDSQLVPTTTNLRGEDVILIKKRTTMNPLENEQKTILSEKHNEKNNILIRKK